MEDARVELTHWPGTVGVFTQLTADALPIPGTSVDDLDLANVERHIARARQQQRYAGTDNPTQYLKEHSCLAPLLTPSRDVQVCATLAGMLCFGRAPQRNAHLRQAVVDIGHYSGTESITFDVVHLEKNIGGTIFEQLERVEGYIHRHTRHGIRPPKRGFEREEIHEYPPAVVRELTVNMLVHRDYGIFGSAARVALFADRIEWFSPGGLPPGVSIEDLLNCQQARNPALLAILDEAGYVEGYGMGLDTVVHVLEQEEMAPPTFRDVVSAFIVTVRGRVLGAHAEPGAFQALPETQRRIAFELQEAGSLSPRELRARLPHRSSRSLQRDLRNLQASGIIEAEGGSVALRYRLRRNPGSLQQR